MNTGENLDHRRVNSSVEQRDPSHRFRLFTARLGRDVSGGQRRPVVFDEQSIRGTFERPQQIERRAREPSLAVHESIAGVHVGSEVVSHHLGHVLGGIAADEPPSLKFTHDFANDFASPKGFRVEATHQESNPLRGLALERRCHPRQILDIRDDGVQRLDDVVQRLDENEDKMFTPQ